MIWSCLSLTLSRYSSTDVPFAISKTHYHGDWIICTSFSEYNLGGDEREKEREREREGERERVSERERE